MSHSLGAICVSVSKVNIDAMADKASGQTVPLIEGNTRPKRIGPCDAFLTLLSPHVQKFAFITGER